MVFLTSSIRGLYLEISYSTAIPVFVYNGIEGQPILPAGGEVCNFDSWITDESQFALLYSALLEYYIAI